MLSGRRNRPKERKIVIKNEQLANKTITNTYEQRTLNLQYHRHHGPEIYWGNHPNLCSVDQSHLQRKQSRGVLFILHQ